MCFVFIIQVEWQTVKPLYCITIRILMVNGDFWLAWKWYYQTMIDVVLGLDLEFSLVLERHDDLIGLFSFSFIVQNPGWHFNALYRILHNLSQLKHIIKGVRTRAPDLITKIKSFFVYLVVIFSIFIAL